MIQPRAGRLGRRLLLLLTTPLLQLPCEGRIYDYNNNNENDSRGRAGPCAPRAQLLADLTESVAGAVVLDSHLDMARALELVVGMIAPELEAAAQVRRLSLRPAAHVRETRPDTAHSTVGPSKSDLFVRMSTQ